MYETTRPVARPPSRYLAGFLTGILPGLGQLFQGRPRAAFAYLLPTLLFLVGALVLVLSDPTRTFLTLLDPTVLLLLLVLQALVLAWRLMALRATLADPRLPRLRARDALPVLLLVAFFVLPQLWLGYTTALVRGATERIFVAQPTDPDQTPIGPEPAAGERVNVLLLGIDSAPGRRHALTDTIMVVSVDPTGETVSMLSVPRDMVDVPLPEGGVFRPKINSLVQYAETHPEEFPEAKGNGVRVLAGALTALLGVPIHYYAEVDLGGFVKLVDSVGGVDVRVTKALNAPDYRSHGVDGFSVKPGLHHFGGGEALAYARIRKSAGESDFTRAGRQQEVLVALRDRIVGGGFLRDLAGFFSAAASTVSTDVPPARLPFLAGLMQEIGGERTFRAVIQPPLVAFSRTPDPRGSILIPDRPAIRRLAAALFPPPGETPSNGTAAQP